MSQDFEARLHPRPRSPMPIKARVEGSGVVVVTVDSFTCPVNAMFPPPLLGAGISVIPLMVKVFGPNVEEVALLVPGPSWIGDQLMLRLDEPAETLPPVDVPTNFPTPPSVRSLTTTSMVKPENVSVKVLQSAIAHSKVIFP